MIPHPSSLRLRSGLRIGASEGGWSHNCPTPVSPPQQACPVRGGENETVIYLTNVSGSLNSHFQPYAALVPLLTSSPSTPRLRSELTSLRARPSAY